MSDILGKSQQPWGQPFPGRWFEIHPKGIYEVILEEIGTSSSRINQITYGLIDVNRPQHTLGLFGKFLGLNGRDRTL